MAMLRKHSIDVVLCDMHMARCDGMCFLALKGADPALADIPVIMRTGDEGLETMVKAFELGAQDYVAKTAAVAELQARLAVHLKLKRVTDELRRQREQLEQLTRQDVLTGLANRRGLDELLSREVGRSKRYSCPMSVVMIDLDRFKEINDTYGHQAGDHVLREVAEIVRRAVRTQDIVARYGGEELAILMPETAMEQAAMVAERLRVDLSNAVIRWRDHELRVTASFGVVGTPTMPTQEPAELVRLADRALYRAKALGRNRVSLARPDTAPTSSSGKAPVGQA
jgi:two-component system cell cycle response regulator